MRNHADNEDWIRKAKDHNPNDFNWKPCRYNPYEYPCQKSLSYNFFFDNNWPLNKLTECKNREGYFWHAH